MTALEVGPWVDAVCFVLLLVAAYAALVAISELERP